MPVPSSFPPNPVSLDKAQKDGVSSSWNCAKPAGTQVFPRLLASAPRPHLAALMTPPASQETRTIAGGGKFQRYVCLKGLSQASPPCALSIIYSPGYDSVRFRAAPNRLLSGGWGFWGFGVRYRVITDLCLQMVLKINGIFEARRGKKRMKRVSQSTESSSGRGKNANTDDMSN